MSVHVNDPDPLQLGFARQQFWDLFEIDIRSLALLRIALGVMILVDLANRFSNLELFYTDEGILTRAMSQDYLGEGFWSLYWIDGTVGFTQILFAVTAAVAVGLIVGFNTRLMTILCLILVASLQVRNPLVLTGGHILLRMMLFWSMFLPLGAVWSVDAHLSHYREPERWRVASAATMGIMLQVAFMYFFSGIAKLNGYWFDGLAIDYILGMEMYVKPLGQWLRGFPFVLHWLSIFTVSIEIVAPVLLFMPGYNKFFRGMAMALFWLMHIAIWATMSIGIFSLMAIVAWLVFVPTQFWKMFQRTPSSSKRDYEWELTPTKIVIESVCGFALFLVVLLNCANIDPAKSQYWFPQAIRTFSNQTLLVQEFKLFGVPPVVSPEFKYEVKTAGGETLDLFGQMIHAPGDRPQSTYQYLGSQHWRRIHSNLITAPDQPTPAIIKKIRQRILERLVHEWNDSHDSTNQIVDATSTCQLREITLNKTRLDVTTEVVWANWKSR